MWIYFTLAVGVLIAFNALIVIAVSVVASVAGRHAEPRDELDAELQARLLDYVR